MTFVVTEPCIGCKDRSCVVACPVDAFHEGPDLLVINPDSCIDCNVCVPECPVDAIFDEDDVPVTQIHMIPFNDKWSKVWPVRTKK